MRNVHWRDYDDDGMDDRSSSEESVRSEPEDTDAAATNTTTDDMKLEDGHPHDTRF
jgi:hypothetical protein